MELVNRSESWWDLVDAEGVKWFEIWTEGSNAWFRQNKPPTITDFAVVEPEPQAKLITFYQSEGNKGYERVGFMSSFLFLLNKELYDPCPP